MPGTAVAVAVSPVAAAGGAAGAASVWAAWFDSFWLAKGAASQAASYLDLVGSANLTEGVAPTWNTATGWTGNGSSMYLLTGLVPTATTSLLVAFSSQTNDGRLAGSTGGSGLFAMASKWFGFGKTAHWGAGGSRSVAPEVSSGVLGLVGDQMYYNGSAVGAAIGGSFGAGAVQMALLAQWVGATANNFTDGTIIAAGYKPTVMDAAAVAAASAAMAAL